MFHHYHKMIYQGRRNEIDPYPHKAINNLAPLLDALAKMMKRFAQH